MFGFKTQSNPDDARRPTAKTIAHTNHRQTGFFQTVMQHFPRNVGHFPLQYTVRNPNRSTKNHLPQVKVRGGAHMALGLPHMETFILLPIMEDPFRPTIRIHNMCCDSPPFERLSSASLETAVSHCQQYIFKNQVAAQRQVPRPLGEIGQNS